MLRCEHCQEKLPEYAHYCSRCGHAVGAGASGSAYRKAALEGVPAPEASAGRRSGWRTEANRAAAQPTLVLPRIPETRPAPTTQPEPTTLPPTHTFPASSAADPLTPIPPSLTETGAAVTHITDTPTQPMPVVFDIPAQPASDEPTWLLPGRSISPDEQGMLPVAPSPALVRSRARRRPWMTWLIVCIACLLIVSGVVGAFLLSLAPTLSLEGSSSVIPGGILRIHGSGFVPESQVTLLLDSRIPLATGRALTGGQGNQLSDTAALAQLLASHQFHYQATGNAISTGLGGTFEIAVLVDPRWSPGRHTILAVDSIGSHTAAVSFIILPAPAQLSFLPSILDFGQLEQGTKAVLTLSLFNAGGSLMYWSAKIGGNATWLHLSQKAGSIRANNGQQLLYVTADAAHLKLGTYRATVQLYSDGGQISLPVHVQVVPFGTKSPRLQVAPATLFFGQVQQGMQITLSVAISNTGARTLHWRASVGAVSWLTLTPTAGSIQRGGQPQTIQLTALTAGLAPGNYTATIAIQSDGGNSTVTCLLTVLSPAPNVIILSPTPTFRPTPRVTISPPPSPTSSASPTPAPTATLTPTPTDTPTPTPTPTDTPTPTPTPTDTPTPTPTPTDTPTPTPTDTSTPTPVSTTTPAPSVTASP